MTMYPRPEPSGHDDYEELAAGWALHALEPDDEARFAAHLPGCTTCQDAIAGYEEAVTELAYLSPAAEPPARLGERIHAEVARDLPARPVVVPLAPRRSSPVRWLAAAAAVIALVLGAGNIVQYQQTRDQDARADRQAARLRADAEVLERLLRPGAQVSGLSPTSGGPPVAYVVVHNGTMEVISHNMDRNDPDKNRYVLWMVGDSGEPTAMTAFDVHQAGVSLAGAGRLPSVAGGIDTFAVSIEPRQDGLPARPTNVMAQGKAVT